MRLEKFQVFLENYVEFLEEVAAGESEKYAALLSYDAKKVDRVTSIQQALNMRLSQMEQQRVAEQERAGLGGFTLQQILERTQGDERVRFAQLCDRFARAVNDIKYYNGKAMNFAQGGLELLGVTEEKPQGAAYGADGTRAGDIAGTVLFEAKI